MNSGSQAKRHAPATLRNREAIAAVLREELPPRGAVLEVASGSGEHAVFFAERFPDLEWQPSDCDADALASNLAYYREYQGSNLRLPLALDANTPSRWEVMGADAVLCINMVHNSPWTATEGLFKGAVKLLGGRNLPLIIYGPFFEAETETTSSNLAFDDSLKARDRSWGLREVERLDQEAERFGFTRSARYPMPANNVTLVYRSAAMND
jgi:hypothetical protein